MKNDLTCEVVQDLLPSYVDHLTSDVTNTAIETHIRECADCRRILSDMQTPEPVPAQTATDASTIDFLKKSNKRNKRRILAAILIVTLLLGSIWGYRTYFYPAPLKNTALIDYAVTVKDNKTIQIKVLVVEVITHRQAPTIRASPLCGTPRIKSSVTITVLGYIVIAVTFRQAELQVFRHPYTAANLHRRIAFAITVIDQEIPRFIIGRSILVLVRSVRIRLSRRLSRSRRLHSTFFIRNTTIKFLRKLSKVIVVLIRSNPNLATPHRRTHKRTRIIDASEKHIGATIVLLFRSKRIVHIRTTPVARIAEHVVKATGNHCSIA